MSMPQSLNHLAILAQLIGGGQGNGAGKFGPAGAAPAPNPMLGIPGMGGGGGRGGFMARGAGQTGGMSPITQTVLGKEAEKRRQQAMKLQEKARMMEQEANELEMPKLQRPVNDTEAGIGSILMLLAGALGGGDGAAEFADGFMRSRQQASSRADEENMRRYQQQQRSMQIGAGNEMERAKMELGEADRIEGRVDNERDRMQKIADEERANKQWYERADYTQANRLNVDRQKAIGAALKSPNPEIRRDAARKYFEGDEDAVAAFGTLSPAEQLAIKRGDYTVAQTNLADAKTQTENEMRPGRLRKLDADVEKVLQSTATDAERQKQIKQKIEMYPDEYKLRAANIYSLMANRGAAKGGKEEKYFGEGSEATFKQMISISTKIVEPLYKKMLNGDELSPEEQGVYDHHTTELKKFQDLLAKTVQAKADYHLNKQGIGGGAPAGGTYGKDTGWHKGVAEWVKKQGFEPSAGFNPGRHNKGSQHDYGDALDVRIGGKTRAQIEAFMKEALRMGWSVRDERIKPTDSEQKKWGGPHIHLSRPKDGVPKMTRTTGGGRASTPKNDTKPAPKADSGVKLLGVREKKS